MEHLVSAAGQVKDLVIRSGALIRQMRVQVYLPPNYGERRARYPVIYLLHDWGSDERMWADSMMLPEVADHLINAQAVPPFIAVMPQGDKSFFINAANPHGNFAPLLRFDPDYFAGALEGCGDYADFLLDDVMCAIEQRFTVRTDRAARVIAGVGMGGAGAAILGFMNPGLFGAVGIHSPMLYSADHHGPPWIFGLGDAAAFACRCPEQLAERLTAETAPRIYLDCGYDDENYVPSTSLHYTLGDRGIPHSFAPRVGDHDADYWRTHFAEYLGFYAAGW